MGADDGGHYFGRLLADETGQGKVVRERRRPGAPDRVRRPQVPEVFRKRPAVQAGRGVIPERHAVAVPPEQGRRRGERQRGPLGPPDARLLRAAPLAGVGPAVRRGGIEEQNTNFRHMR